MRGPAGTEPALDIYILGRFADQAGWDDLLARLAWYFSPWVDRIRGIHLCAARSVIEKARAPEGLDPAIADLLPGLVARLRPLPTPALRRALSAAVPGEALLLAAEAGMAAEFPDEIARFRAAGRFFAVDARKDRNEGSHFLWAGVRAFTDMAADTAREHERFTALIARLGPVEKVHVFGTGPSLSAHVETADLSGGICIAANSMVKNDELMDRMRPPLIVAADPIFHAGCSLYAAAFRAALARALERTGAWFLCPLRDAAIYRRHLPAPCRDRVIGIPFDAVAPPPSDLTRSFALKPYPNVLTLFLLPLAATLAREIRIAGCDGRPIGEDSAFWSHDAKAQFTDEMANIRATHPGFFAIDYNDYYLDHAHDLETVLSALEADGKVCISDTPSFLPALHARERAGLRPGPARKGFDPKAVAILDPDAKGDWGHYLSYDRRLGRAVRAGGRRFALIGRADLPASAWSADEGLMIPVLTRHSWEIGARGAAVQTADLSRFAADLESGFAALEAALPEGDILVFIYCGSLEAAELLEHVLVSHPRISAVVTLFYAYRADPADAAWQARWRGLIARLAGPRQVRLMVATAQDAARFHSAIGIRLPVLPHPSTTFDDAEAGALAHRPPPALKSPARVLFPGGVRAEKGFLIAAGAAAELAADPALEVVLRARTDASTAPALRRAVEALGDKGPVRVETRDFEAADLVRWLGSADVMVIPYLPEAFAARTSGMLVDAMLLGIPVVVVEGTWLADEIAAHGGGIAVPASAEGLAAGVRAVLRDHARHAAATRAAAATYLGTGNWASLVGRVVECVAPPPQSLLPPAAATFLLREGGEYLPLPLAAVAARLPDLVPEGAGAPAALLVWDDPQDMLARAIAAGEDAGAALAGWLRELRMHLVLARTAGPACGFVARGRLAEGIAAAPGLGLPAVPPRPAPDPLDAAVAALLVAQDPEAARLLAELESGTDPDRLPLRPTPAAAEAALTALRRAAAGVKSAAKVAVKPETKPEAGAEAALALAKEQVVQLQATLEASWRDAEALRAELGRIYASKSWRVTEPLRGVRRRLGGAG